MRKNLIGKLSGDINSVNLYIEKYYGNIILDNNELKDNTGVSIHNNFEMVDTIKKDLNVYATIFKIENDDFIRVTTNIINSEGKRAIGTKLGKDSAAYSSVINGKLYIGEANILGKPYYTSYNPIFDANRQIIGIAFIGISKTESLLIVNTYRKTTFFSAVIIIVFLIIISMVLSGFINNIILNRPLGIMIESLKNISEGEGDLTLRIEVKSHDEIGDMAKYFNLTFNKIKSLIIAVKNQSVLLGDTGIILSTNMTETATAVNEISANIQSIRSQAGNQNVSVTKTITTMENITKGIEKLNRLIDNQSANVTESSSAIEEMMASISSVTQTLYKNTENIKRLSQSSESGRVDLNKVAADIKEVVKESQNLLEISSVIQNIASQTNLLSMNASIEAAHAGESGKGFAVVADEVRKLAESSGQQAKIVADVLKRIKLAIDSITQSITCVTDTFVIIESEVKTVNEQENIIRSAMEEQSAGSKEILKAISELNDITQKVKSGSDEIMSGSSQVIHETEVLNTITYEITNGINEMVVGTEQVTVAVNKVNDLVIDNKVSIDGLVNEVGRFKVD